MSLGSRHAICYLCFCCRVYLEISIAIGPSLFPFEGRDSTDSANHEDLGRRTGSIDAPVADRRGESPGVLRGLDYVRLSVECVLLLYLLSMACSHLVIVFSVVTYVWLLYFVLCTQFP